jgi:hypothetical protein
MMKLGKSGGKHWRFETGAAWRSPGFEINDIGFLRRADEINHFAWTGLSMRNPFSIFRRAQLNFNEWLDWDFGGTLLAKQANTNFNMHFKNNWQWGAGATRTWEYTSNSAPRGGPSSKRPGQWSSWFWVNSDFTKKIYTGFGADFNDGDEKAKFRNWWVDLTLRPTNPLTVTLSPSYSKTDANLQFVDITTFGPEDRFLFGTMEQKTAALTVRLDYAVRPNLTIQYYGAPFLSAGKFRDFKRITSPRAEEYRDRFHTFDAAEIAAAGAGYDVDEDRNGSVDYSFENPDFNFRDFNSNLVLRWEFQPGSLAYLVWSQARDDRVQNGRFALGNDVEGLFDVHPHNIFLVKVSKWFSL